MFCVLSQLFGTFIKLLTLASLISLYSDFLSYNSERERTVYVCMYVCMAALGLHCCPRAFSSCDERSLLFVVVHGLLIAVASLVAVCGL